MEPKHSPTLRLPAPQHPLPDTQAPRDSALTSAPAARGPADSCGPARPGAQSRDQAAPVPGVPGLGGMNSSGSDQARPDGKCPTPQSQPDVWSAPRLLPCPRRCTVRVNVMPQQGIPQWGRLLPRRDWWNREIGGSPEDGQGGGLTHANCPCAMVLSPPTPQPHAHRFL